jgi:signal transduction histidine kinase
LSPRPFRERLAAAALPAAVVGLIGLLAGLGVMQHRWLDEVKQAELQRRRASAQARADAFARDLDRELGRLTVLLHVDAAALQGGRLTELGERLRAWRAESPRAAMLKDLWFVRAGEAEAPPTISRFDERGDSLEPAAWPADLLRVRDRVASKAVPGVQPDAPVLLAPVLPVALPVDPGREAAAGGAVAFHFASSPREWLLMRFDLDALRTRVLPELERIHFGTDGEYHLRVVRGADHDGTPVYASPGAPAVPGADVEAALFSPRLDDVDGAVLAHLAARRSVTRIELTAERHGAGEGPASPLAPTARSAVVLRMGTSGSSAWRLRVAHREGSLEAAVGAAQRRQALVAAGILVVLAGSVALLALSQRRARTLLQRQGEFVAGVSHELRTPLAVIRSAAENLRDGVVATPEQAKRYGTTLAEEGLRLSEMVEQLLEFAGADAPERARRRGPVPVPALLERAARQAGLADEGIAVEWTLAPDLPAVWGEPGALQRVFANLLANARRHGEGRGVAVAARVEGRRVVITVSDRGPGLGDADRGRLFEPFYRGRRAVDGQLPGSGLGLSVVRRSVEAHGGRIRAEENPGGGAAFVVELPAAPTEAAIADAVEPLRSRS